MLINGKKYNKNCNHIFVHFSVQVISLVMVLFFMETPGYGFTRKLVADYPDGQAGNISHYVVLKKKNAGNWVRFEKPFAEACTGGTCTMELDLDPESDYAFKAFFKNAAGDGNAAQIFYKTGKLAPAEDNPPVITATSTLISDTLVLIQGKVQDSSHVDVRVLGNKTIQNFGYPDFNFTLDVAGASSILLEAKDIHGNMSVATLHTTSLSIENPLQSTPLPLQPVTPATQANQTPYVFEENSASELFFYYVRYIYAKEAFMMNQTGVYNTLEIVVAAIRAACAFADTYRYFQALYALNPFDETAYLEDKLADLILEDPVTWGNSSVEDLRAYLLSFGMTPFIHYMIFGVMEGNPGPYFLPAQGRP